MLIWINLCHTDILIKKANYRSIYKQLTCVNIHQCSLLTGNGLPGFMGNLKVQTDSSVFDSLFRKTEGTKTVDSSQQEFVGN